MLAFVVGIASRKTIALQKASAAAQAPSPAESNHAQPVTSLPAAAPPANTAHSLVARANAPTHSSAKPARSNRSLRLATEPGKAEPVVVPTSTIQLAVQHQFKDATLSVWIDDQLALTLALHGGTQKRLVIFHGLKGAGSETLRVPAGSHVLRLKAKSADQSIDLSKTISANFIGSDDKTLQVTFDKRNTTMYLNWH
jgi:hypothetical protein